MAQRTPIRSVLIAFASTLILALGIAFVASAPPSGAAVSDGWEVIDVGYHHTCGLTTVGEAFCWGDASQGALGDGRSDLPGRQRIPLEIPKPAGVTWETIESGQYHSCALTTDGDLYCWGNDGYDGSLGNGPGPVDTFYYPDPGLVDTPAGVTWASISAGRHTCALTTDGDAYCWGRGAEGQIGNGANNGQQSPALVSAPAGVVWESIEVGSPDSNNLGSNHTCAVSTNGVGYCWGSDTYGQLGNDLAFTATNTPSPVLTPVGVSWATVSPGLNFTCGVTTDGAGFCWGRSPSGQLGVGARTEPAPTPLEVLTPTGVTWAQIDPGGFYTCGVSTGDELYCWGSEGLTGSMGNGPLTGGTQPEPIPVSTPAEVDGWSHVSTGYQHTCAVATDGVGWCFGSDSYGKLGNGGTDTKSDVPLAVLGEEPSGGPQQITFLFGGQASLLESPVFIRAISDSFLPIVFTSDTPTVCTVSPINQLNNYTRANVTLLAMGTCTITANQPGDGTWDAAPPVTRSITVVGAAATASLSDLSATYDGSPKAATVTTNPPGLATTITYDGSTTAPTNAGSYAVVATVTESGYSAVQATGTLVIAKAHQTISFGPLANTSFGDPPVPISATAISGLPVSFAVAGPCTTNGTSVTLTNAGSCTVTATQAGSANWLAATPVPQTFTISGAASTVDVSGWAASYDGTAKPITVATTPAGLATSITYDGSATAPTNAGSYAVVATVTEFGYDPTQVTGTLTIAQATQTVSVDPLDPMTYGGATQAIIALADSGLPVSLVASGACGLASTTLTSTGAGTCTVTASQAGDTNRAAAAPVNVSVAVAQATSTINLVGPPTSTEVGTNATFTATITGPGAPAGSATFSTGGGIIQAVPVVNGIATWTVNDLPLGDAVVSATYDGDPNREGSAATPVTHTVVTAPLTLTGLPDEIEAGEEVTVAVSGFGPEEDIEFVFESDPVVVGTATAGPTGAASLNFAVPAVEVGAHTLTASGATTGLSIEAVTAIVEVAPPVDPTTPVAPTTPVTSPPATTPTNPPADNAPVAAVGSTSSGSTSRGSTSGSTSRSSGQLPRTGSDSTWPMTCLGALLIAAGAVLVSRSRQRAC